MMVWDAILEIKKKLSNYEGSNSKVYVNITDHVEVTLDHTLDNATFELDLNANQSLEAVDITVNNDHGLSTEALSILNLYLPYALLPYYSKKYSKCYSISHFAQTLDGRIASSSGDSKWIGNEENLIHAHRMRALCDAILIGAKTLDADDPSLNVRLVSGTNPIKVIVGGNDLPIDSYKAVDSSTILFCRNRSESNIIEQKIILDKAPVFDAERILAVLADKGIYSVYIEGGAFTTSNFLKQGQIDQVQIHVSPQILGSGTSAFCFDGVLNMKQSIKFTSSSFIPMGSDVMFIGNLI